jgi:hypothetical protein
MEAARTSCDVELQGASTLMLTDTYATRETLRQHNMSVLNAATLGLQQVATGSHLDYQLFDKRQILTIVRMIAKEALDLSTLIHLEPKDSATIGKLFVVILPL